MLYHWFYEPERVRVKLNEKYRLLLFNKLEKFGGPHALSRKIGCSPATICNYFKGLGLSVGFLKKILDNLKIPYEEIEPLITEISWVRNPKLPFNLDTVEISSLSAAILGDGSNTTRLMYKNTRSELIKKVEIAAKKVFGEITIDHRVTEKGILYVVFPRIVGRVLTFNEIPYGNKIYQNNGIPNSIKKCGKKTKKAFLQQFFDDEGGVEVNYRRIFLSQSTDCTKYLPKNFYNSMEKEKAYYIKDIPNSILRELHPSKILVDIKTMMKKSFNISSTLRFKRIRRYENHATSFWELDIGKKDDIRRFYERINFYSYDKKNDLNFMVNRSYEMPWNIYEMIINESIQISKKQGFFVPSNVSKNLNLPFNSVNKRIKFLNKLGIFSRKENGYILNIKT